jgi:hypothetical protein
LEAVIKAAEQAIAGQASDALKTMEPLAEQTRQSSAIVEIFGSTAESQAKAGRVDAAANVMKVAIALASTVRGDGGMALAQVAIYQAAIQAYAGRFAEARADAVPLALNRIAEAEAVAHAKAGRKVEALKAAGAVGNYLGSLRTLCVVAETYAKAGRPADAAEVLKLAMAQAEKLSPLDKPDAFALIAPAQASAGQLANALKTADAITKDELQSKAIAEIVRALARAGQFAEARELAASLDGAWRVAAINYIAAATPR